MNMAALSALQPVGVVGAGAMGAGIAQVAALAGHPVRLFDLRADAARQAVDSQRAQLAQLAGKGRLDAALAEAASARLSAVSELAELAGCALVIEAIVEQLEAKQALFRQLEAIVGDDALLASNTSSISLTAIAAPLTRPQRLAGLHFFNPAPRMALVEVIAGLATAPEVIDTLMATARAWGKTPVRAKSTPGFIVNRVARPYYAEALRLAQEGAASPATLDALLREAGGFRMGPFELMDMIGHDVNFAVTSSVWRGYFHDPRFLPSLMQQDLVEAGFLGRKRGRGFYDYRDGAAMPQADSAPPLPPPAQLAVCGDSPAARALAARLHAHGVAFAALPSIDGRVAQADDAVLFVTDGRSASQRAASAATSPAATSASGASQSRLAGRSLAITARPQAMLSSTDTEVASLVGTEIDTRLRWMADTMAASPTRPWKRTCCNRRRPVTRSCRLCSIEPPPSRCKRACDCGRIIRKRENASRMTSML